MRCKTIRASDILLNGNRLDAKSYMEGHWTRISQMGARCAGCNDILQGGSNPVWSTDKGLFCSPKCDPDHKE